MAEPPVFPFSFHSMTLLPIRENNFHVWSCQVSDLFEFFFSSLPLLCQPRISFIFPSRLSAVSRRPHQVRLLIMPRKRSCCFSLIKNTPSSANGRRTKCQRVVWALLKRVCRALIEFTAGCEEPVPALCPVSCHRCILLAFIHADTQRKRVCGNVSFEIFIYLFIIIFYSVN